MKRKVAGGWAFIIIIPIGVIASFFLYDFGAKLYYQNKLNKDTKVVFEDFLNRPNLDSKEVQIDYIKGEFKKLGYDLNDISLKIENDEYIIITYNNYMSMVGTISFGKIGSKMRIVSSSYKGYYNEYQEAIIEKYQEDNIEEN